MKEKQRGVSLLELIVVVIILGVLATLAIPQFNTSRERSLGYEAQANLKLIAAAEKIYRLEASVYYPSSGSQSSLSAINSNLRLSISGTNWDYTVYGGASAFTATADRPGSGGFLNCQYTINNGTDTPTGNINCP